MPLNIAIVPAGQWGTALAVPLSRGGHRVRLYFREAVEAEHFNTRRVNRKRLPGVIFPGNVSATADLAAAVHDVDLVVVAPSSGGLRDVCRQLRPHLPHKAVIVSVVKAMFPEEPRLPSELIGHELFGAAAGDSQSATCINDERIAVISGPNFAVEVAQELPAGTVAASANIDTARFVQSAFMTDRFRVWTSTDIVGVQLGGALKNIVAIGTGISDGLGMGHNARATLITRSVAEIARLGSAFGADSMTFAGVSGIGDLMLTCTGDLSRNRRAGLAIARGEAIDPNTTVEGVPTAKATYMLAQELGIDMPITEVVYRILYEGLSPKEGLRYLMTRQPRPELDGRD